MIVAHYPGDSEALAKMPAEQMAKFEKWFSDLDAAHERRGCPYGEGGLAKMTGIECWMTAFEEGLEPAHALDEDLSCAYE